MKNINKFLILFLTGLFIASCDEKLDINVDPNAPAEINAGLALTSAEGTLASVVGGEFMNLGGFYAEYHTQAPSASQFENIDSYNLNTAYANTPWTQLYAGVLTDLKYVTEKSNDAGDTATALMAEVLRGYTYQLLVDLFGDVPYTEALQDGNITPHVTPGEEIYADVISKIDAALAAYEADPTESSAALQDVIFNSNMDKWVQFANTLKLKMYIRMAYTPQANPAAVTALLNEGNFLTEDAKFNLFAESTNKTNPFYATFLTNAGSGLGDVNHVASDALHDFYTENNDARLRAAFRPGTGGTYNSISQGTGNDFNNTAVAYARPNVRPKTPVFFLSASESYFLQAEALIRYAAGAGAKEAYDAGVLASFMTYQENFFKDADATKSTESVWSAAEAASEAADLTGPGGAYEYQPGADAETTVRQVIIQKWAALPYINNIEAYIEATRTKYPEIVEEGTEDYTIGNRIPSSISILPGTTIPSILFYPDSETQRNPNITQRASITENVWWDQKPE
ncbi:SusD/RagB family nutrient-binding outer membrane lipoprotein [Flavobacterium album]|uniref:SusD/RagB family nutrient-binding outer membrane lipoprotein n=1 Tax=Flavobacterium album TaxID=2175091 RepID=A0A2S1QTW4_9FLAO|nr:SusD/RagB family nutrient-binding outer membrane lipoprotein [Flavobacterium album]AWH83823.1 SusD/RagB family nutrient-binding outer membrane lipoprotein [Flavobacterium album]